MTEGQEPIKRSIKSSIKKAAVILGLSVGLIVAGFEGWDVVGTLHLDAVSSPDGGAGYGYSAPAGSSFGKISLGYSTGPDDKNYLRLPGVPSSPRRTR